MHPFRLLVFVLTLAAPPSFAAEAAPPSSSAQIDWQPWSPDIFQKAQAQHRLVLLDLEAVWCHWCHVMDDQTYANPEVIRLIRQHFIAVRVDQDARPDLSNRYGDYGWPATILFDSRGGELAKRQGYLPPLEMSSMLAAFIKDPTPGPSATSSSKLIAHAASGLSAAEQARLETLFRDNYDTKAGAWGFGHKFLDWTSVEYAMCLAQSGDAAEARQSRQALDVGRQLLDPVWGGVYQYSTDGDWVHPHFEKLAEFQAENMKVYALASTFWPDGGYAENAAAIARYVDAFLTSPQGAFYTSQDADVIDGQHSADYFALDDAGRRKIGIPHVDSHVYARENGWMIQGLVALSNATGDASSLAKAERAAAWIEAHRSLPGGGFRHDAGDEAGPYLGDTLAMGGAFLALYGATGDRAWLAKAEHAADFIESHFKSPATGTVTVGYVMSASRVGGVFAAEPSSDENDTLARFANLLFHYSGNARYRGMAKFAIAYSESPGAIQANRDWTGSLLLADTELNSAPLHVTVVGPRNDSKAQALFQAARALPGIYKETEWLDPREGPLPGSDVTYPQAKAAEAFLCTANSCSSPLPTPEALKSFVAKRSPISPGK